MTLLTVTIVGWLLAVCAILTTNVHGRSFHKSLRKGHERRHQDIELEKEMTSEYDDLHESTASRIKHHAESRGSNEASLHHHRGPSSRFHAITKRHNMNLLESQIMGKEEELLFRRSQKNFVRSASRYEFEVKEVQNSAICNYTVTEIPDKSADQSRVPKKLYSIECNHTGSRCKDTGSFCCIQTYSTIEVRYGNDTSEVMKIFNGCVCSLTMPGQLKSHSVKLPKGAIDA